MTCSKCQRKPADFYVVEGNLVRLVCPPCIWANKITEFKVLPKASKKRRKA